MYGSINTQYMYATHIPIRVGSKCNEYRQVSWLLVIIFSAFPYKLQWLLRWKLTITVAGPRWTFTNFPIKSFLRHHIRSNVIFTTVDYTPKGEGDRLIGSLLKCKPEKVTTSNINIRNQKSKAI